MNKLIVALGTVAMLGSASAVLADNHKVAICHNGSTYNSEVEPDAPISFVITIAGKAPAKAAAKHVANHDDLEDFVEDGEGEECELDELGDRVCSVVMLCKADDPE